MRRLPARASKQVSILIFWPSAVPNKTQQKLSFARLAHLGLGKVHFGVLLHELLQHVVLLLLVRGGQARSFLPLIVHHFFHLQKTPAMRKKAAAAAAAPAPGSMLLSRARQRPLRLRCAEDSPPSRAPCIFVVVVRAPNRLARFAVEVAELAVLGVHAARVDFGLARHHALPPLHLVRLHHRKHHLEMRG